MTKLPTIIAVDFDGTICINAWPQIGDARMDVIVALHKRAAQGAKLILWTCREGRLLEEALRWCEGFGLRFDAVNANLPKMIETYGWDCRKISADEYWDDKGVAI